MNQILRTATFRARAGHGPELADALLDAAALVSDAPGCELWLVHRDDADPDAIHVTEMWASQEQCDASLEAAGVPENIARVMALLDGAPQLVATRPLGGARMLNGTTGAQCVSILDSPDLSVRYGLQETGESRYVRDEIGAVQVGLSHYRLRPGRRQGFSHRHGSVEEVYVALAGDGHIDVDGEQIPLTPLSVVRVAPSSARELIGGADGLEILAFGTHIPGDGEMVSAEA